MGAAQQPTEKAPAFRPGNPWFHQERALAPAGRRHAIHSPVRSLSKQTGKPKIEFLDASSKVIQTLSGSPETAKN
jgi:hypothetical protein